MWRTNLQEPSPPRQLFLQRPPTGAAQRSGAKSGAERFDLSSDHNTPACNQPDPTAFTLKAPSLSAATQPLNSPNILPLMVSPLILELGVRHLVGVGWLEHIILVNHRIRANREGNVASFERGILDG
jgi:hypothetical protein